MNAKKETPQKETVDVPDTILGAVFKTSRELGTLGKDDFNPHAKYKYVSIDKYYEKVPSAALANGLYWMGKQVGFKGLNDKYVSFDYEFDLYHQNGEKWEKFYTTTIIHPIQGAQTSSSADSYAEKSFMRRTFKIITGEKDAEAEQAERKSVVGISKLKQEYTEFYREINACSDLDQLVAFRNSSLEFLERAPEWESGWYGDGGDIHGLKKDLDIRYNELKAEQDSKQ